MLLSANADIVPWSATICNFIDSWIPGDVDNPLTFWKTNQVCSFEKYDMLSPMHHAWPVVEDCWDLSCDHGGICLGGDHPPDCAHLLHSF